MTDISVTRLSRGGGKYIFEVDVRENGSGTKHEVVLSESYYNEITGGKISVRELVQKSFEFLLSRESKESILKKFDLMDISVYFPEYREESKHF